MMSMITENKIKLRKKNINLKSKEQKNLFSLEKNEEKKLTDFFFENCFGKLNLCFIKRQSQVL